MKTILTLSICVIKSYDELKAEMEALQQQMVEAKKNDYVRAQPTFKT